jgi:site-specific recombinase XerD
MEKNSISLSQTIEGYFINAQARRLSPNTLQNYQWAYGHLERFLAGDPAFGSITTAQVRAFLTSLTRLSNKSLLNVHSALSSLWTWAIDEGIVRRNVLREIKPPKPEKRTVVPFTKREVELMLSACDRAKTYTRPGKRACANGRPTALRDRAIVMLLTDTGVRATELCTLVIRDVDLKNHRILILGKGKKERHVRISPRTEQAIWRYLTTRADTRPSDPLFATGDGLPMERNILLRMVHRIGERAGVDDAHPHRFRHTFAVMFLRNGGNIFELKEMLGHESLEMVNYYLHLAQIDLDRAHQDASPVMNWLL